MKNAQIADDYDLDDAHQNTNSVATKPKRPKRPKKSVNENLEPVVTVTPAAVPEQIHYPSSLHDFGSSGFRAQTGEDISMHGNSFT